MAAGRTWSISARWIVTGEGRAIRDAAMRGTGATIEAVGPRMKVAPAAKHRDLGDVAVLPGLINAHTHLELTHLKGRLPPRRSMPQFLFALGRLLPIGTAQDLAVADGIAQALAAGTTALSDISHNHRSWKMLKGTPLRKLCLAEVLGIGPLAGGAVPKVLDRLKGARSGRRIRFGIAPHAPYSTSENIYRKAVAVARRRNWTVATHLAETESERQFLLWGIGEMFEFLARLGMIDTSVTVQHCKPVEFARRVGLLDLPSILGHVNFIDDEELNILSGGAASVAYCPRSSDFFGRTGHRYPEMLQAGVNVVIGTDGLASNESLSMLDEMRRLRQDARVDNYTILRMATLNGARALGWEDSIGSLTPGKQADWIAVQLPPDASDPLEGIFTSNVVVLETVIAGKTVFSR